MNSKENHFTISHFLTRLYGLRDYLALQKNYLNAPDWSENQKQDNYLRKEETLRAIVEENKSISRFGDGELRLAFLQGNTVYEELSIKKAKSLQEVLNSSQKDLIIGVNFYFMENIKWPLLRNVSTQLKKPDSYESIFSKDDILVYNRSKSRTELLKYWSLVEKRFSHNLYGEACVFRSGIFIEAYKEGRIEAIRKSLQKFFNAKSILLICPQNSILVLLDGKNLFAHGPWKSVRLSHIPIPPKNTFSLLNEVKVEISKAIQGHDLVLIQAGATGTILSHWILQNYGIQALDIGNFDWHML
jgi:hypothetical protein